MSLHALLATPCYFLMAGLFPASVRATGFGIVHNLAQLPFAAFAPIIGSALWERLSSAASNEAGGVRLLADAVPALWNYFCILVSAVGLGGIWCAVRSGALPRVSLIRAEERFF